MAQKRCWDKLADNTTLILLFQHPFFGILFPSLIEPKGQGGTGMNQDFEKLLLLIGYGFIFFSDFLYVSELRISSFLLARRKSFS